MVWFWVQFLAFQALWFAAVLGGNQWLPLCLLILVVHFALSPSRLGDLRVLPIALIGILLDSLLTLSGVFQFTSTPYWLAMLWVGFVLTLGHSLAWLRHIPRILLLPIGALAGTASYLAGWKLDAVALPLGAGASSLTLALSWALVLPILVMLDSRIRRTS
jgi:hypothetical protein